MEKIMYVIIFSIIGTFMGSFYTVVGLRLPNKKSFIASRSECDFCQHKLPIYQMIPILSYIFLRGKCHYCHHKIDLLSTYIEFFTGVLFGVAYYSFGWSLDLAIALGVISLLVIVIVSDLTYLIIPDEILYFFTIYFVIIQIFNIGVSKTLYHIGIGGFLFLVMYLIMIIGNYVFKRESMGGGDIKLMFIFGLILDPLLGCITIFLGSLIALPMAIILYMQKKERIIPFGPFLLLAFTIIYFTKINSNMVLSWLGL